MPDPSPNTFATEDAKMLDEMIRRTIGLTDSSSAGNEALHQHLLKVAQAHPMERDISEEIGSELVHAASVSVLNVPLEMQPKWKEISAVVTHTLMNDPSARQQLDSLWHRLHKEVDPERISTNRQSNLD